MNDTNSASMIEILATARQNLAKAKSALEQLETESKYQNARLLVKDLKASVDSMENMIRAMAVTLYTTDKTVMPGTKITPQKNVRLIYSDQDALEYCLTEGKEFLTFNRAELEAYASKVVGTPKALKFVRVEITRGFTASINRDLSEFLPKESNSTEEIPF